jgi:hypothetical protein
MSIPKAVAHQLIGLSQLALSAMETGKLLDAKCTLLRLAAVVTVETDRSDEVERWKAAGMS